MCIIWDKKKTLTENMQRVERLKKKEREREFI